MAVNGCACIESGIQVGNRIRSTGTFTNAIDNYNPIDPSFIYCTVKDPHGIETIYQWGIDAMTRVDTGVYYIEHTISEQGGWFFRWWSEGNVITSSEVSLRALEVATL